MMIRKEIGIGLFLSYICLYFVYYLVSKCIFKRFAYFTNVCMGPEGGKYHIKNKMPVEILHNTMDNKRSKSSCEFVKFRIAICKQYNKRCTLINLFFLLWKFHGH